MTACQFPGKNGTPVSHGGRDFLQRHLLESSSVSCPSGVRCSCLKISEAGHHMLQGSAASSPNDKSQKSTASELSALIQTGVGASSRALPVKRKCAAPSQRPNDRIHRTRYISNDEKLLVKVHYVTNEERLLAYKLQAMQIDITAQCILLASQSPASRGY